MRARGAAGLALALMIAAPVSAQPVDDLQAADALVQTIGWRLSQANARFCPRGAPGIGLLLGDVLTFKDPAAARAVYGLTGDVAVAAVADRSPAAEAGLAANMVITAVGEMPVGSAPRPGSWDRVWSLQTRLEQDAANSGEVALTLAGGRVVHVKAAATCGVRFIVDDGKDNAGATRIQVRVGRKTLIQLGWDETLIAAIMAHEIAHAALDHETVLGPGRRPTAAVRRTEREADRLSVWLLANAGYDPAAAPRMIARISPRGIFAAASSTHGSGRERASDMEAEIAVLRAAPDADWSRRFRREP